MEPIKEPHESHFQIVANASSDAIVTIDEHSNILFANPAVQRVFGYSPEELIGRSLTILMPEYLRHVHENGIRRYLDTGQRHISWEGVELPALHRSGQDLVVEVSFGRFIAEGHSFFTGVIRDVTTRKRTEARRLMEAGVLRVLAENNPTSEIPVKVLQTVCSTLKWKAGLLWTADPSTKVLRLSAAWSDPSPELRRFIDAGRTAVLNESDFPRNHVGAPTGLSFTVAFPIRVAGRVAGVMEFFNAQSEEPDNELRNVLKTIGGHVGQFIERRRSEEEREALLLREQDARAEAEQANRVKDEFLSTISHELRTPMTAIVGWANLLHRGVLSEERRHEAVEIISRNAAAQTRLVDDLLDLSAVITGKVRLNIQPIYIASSVQAAIDSIRPAAEAKGIRLQATLDFHAGPVSADADRIQQIAWNLLSNSVKFTPKNGRVQVILEKPNSHIELRVSDTGMGITEEFLPHVFERFRQTHASITRDHGGMGIGLAIVRQLVELHGGTVHVSSPGAGKGATFIVRLPIRILHHPKEIVSDPSAPAEPLATQALELQHLRVLVVDDHPETTALVQVILEMQGATVTTAQSADQALELLSTTHPQVLISDIGMPGKDGYMLIRDIRKLKPPYQHMPALALTAYARDEDRSRALWAGYDAHLAKPISSETLVAMVATLARRAGN